MSSGLDFPAGDSNTETFVDLMPGFECMFNGWEMPDDLTMSIWTRKSISLARPDMPEFGLRVFSSDAKPENPVGPAMQGGFTLSSEVWR